MNSYAVPKVPSIATVPAGTWLYTTSAPRARAPTTSRWIPAATCRTSGNRARRRKSSNTSTRPGSTPGKSYFVKAGSLANIRAAAPSQDELKAARASGYADAKAHAVAVTNKAAADVAAL